MPADGLFIRRTPVKVQASIMRTSLVLAAVIALLPVAAQAETIRLTPEQAEAAIESGAAKKARHAEGLPDDPVLDRGVHGEVGVAVGTGGYRSMYGVVGVPLGDRGSAVLAYGQERGRGYYGSGVYDPRLGNLCRGVNAELCDWRLNAAQLDALP
jgi:hypothetical protein